jgi:hypothetical protein
MLQERLLSKLKSLGLTEIALDYIEKREMKGMPIFPNSDEDLAVHPSEIALDISCHTPEVYDDWTSYH